MIGFSKNENSKKVKKRLLYAILAVAVPIVLLVLWELAAKAGNIKPSLFPPPSVLWNNFLKLLLSGKLIKSLLISFRRVLTGFLIGMCAGIVIGFLMGLFAPINSALSILVSVFRSIPVIAIIPIFIIVFGIGERCNVAVIIVGAFWSVLLNTISGIKSVDRKLLEVAYVYRVGNYKTVFRIILPAALPYIITGIRLALGAAWMSVVAAEMIGASSGIGYMIMYARELAQPANMYVCVIIIGLIGLALDRILLYIQTRVISKFN